MPRLGLFPVAMTAVALATPAQGGQQVFPETPRPPPPAVAMPIQSSPPAQSVYYFCPATNAYYPYVTSCAVVWREVPTTPPDAELPRVADEREHAPPKPTLPPATEAFLRSLVGPQQGEPRTRAEFRNSSGQACRELERIIVIDGVQQPALAVVCQRADGRWVISAETLQEATN